MSGVPKRFSLIALLGIMLFVAGCSSTIDTVEKTDRWLQEDIYNEM